MSSTLFNLGFNKEVAPYLKCPMLPTKENSELGEGCVLHTFVMDCLFNSVSVLMVNKILDLTMSSLFLSLETGLFQTSEFLFPLNFVMRKKI